MTSSASWRPWPLAQQFQTRVITTSDKVKIQGATVYTIFGVKSPVAGSEEVTRLISEGREEKAGGQLVFEPDLDKMVELALAHIDKKREALGLTEYDPQRFAKPGVT